jgi:hypothetical protein
MERKTYLIQPAENDLWICEVVPGPKVFGSTPDEALLLARFADDHIDEIRAFYMAHCHSPNIREWYDQWQEKNRNAVRPGSVDFVH